MTALRTDAHFVFVRGTFSLDHASRRVCAICQKWQKWPKHSRIARIPVVPAKIKQKRSIISSALNAFFRERSLQIIELGRVRKNVQNASWRFPGTSGVFFPRILPTNTYIYIPVLEYHRIPYSKRVREDAEYIPLIRAFLRSNTPRYSSKLDIGGKIWHQGKNSKSEISSSFRTPRETNERESLHTIISREQQRQQNGSVFCGGAFCGWIILSVFA